MLLSDCRPQQALHELHKPLSDTNTGFYFLAREAVQGDLALFRRCQNPGIGRYKNPAHNATLSSLGASSDAAEKSRKQQSYMRDFTSEHI